jgi:hypothetical protein
MSIRLASLLLLACTTSAFAEPDDAARATKAAPEPARKDKYVAASYMSGDELTGVNAEGAHRFGTSANGFLRAKLAAGTLDDGGNFQQLMFGVEARGTGRWVRAFGGIDLGFELDHRKNHLVDGTTMTELKSHFLTTPRLGIEAGSRTVWLRAALEFPIRAQLADSDYQDDGYDFIEVIGDLGVGVGF